MNQDTAAELALQSIKSQMMIDPQGESILLSHLRGMYGAGFDVGLKENHKFQRVEQFNNEGFSHKFQTAEDAAKYMNVSVSSIYKAIARHGKSAHYYWRYI